MWTAVVGIVGGIVTLLIKAIIDAGSAEHRARQGIIADIELLDVIPSDLDASTLRSRIQARLVEYSRPADAPQSKDAKRYTRVDRRMRATVAVMVAISGAGVATGIASIVGSLEDKKPAKHPETKAEVLILLGALLLSVLLAVGTAMRTYIRMRRLNEFRLERLLAERRR